MRKLIIMLAALLIPLTAITSSAAQMRVFVAGIVATGVQNRDEMQTTLQTLLASRLNGDKILVVGSAADADVVVNGTYVTIGKIFSIDAVAKTAAGKALTRSFIQGKTEDELIPAIGLLAEKLSADLVKSYAVIQPAAIMPQPSVATLAAAGAGAVGGDFIKPSEQVTNQTGGWLSKRLNGAASLMAIGGTLPDGSREIFLAEERRVSYYRQGSDMTLVAENELGDGYKIISLDTIIGSDGLQDIYVTAIRSGEPDSQVLRVKGDKLEIVATGLPYYFRSVGLAGGPKQLYAQSMGRDEDFYGDIASVTRNGSKIVMKNNLKMPRFGNIYNFNQFRDRDGKILTVIINPDGYIVVFGQDLVELWRSNDKFGGSELYFKKEDSFNLWTSGDKYRWIFMNQRIQVSSTGQLLVGKNDGFWVLGNARSYKKGAVYSLFWNGSSLDEKWRTRDTQNYMPDYYYDEKSNELLILQTVQRPGFNTRGASSLTIKKVE